MKNNNPTMCRGVQAPTYSGPEICATLSYRVDGRDRLVHTRGHLSNPRKSEEAVLIEVCARVKAQHPTAKLVSFKRKEGKA